MNDRYDLDDEYMMQTRIERLQDLPENKGLSYLELKKKAEAEQMNEEARGEHMRKLFG